MNKEEKVVGILLTIAVATLAATCILSLQKCITTSIFVIATSLWAYAWSKALVFEEGEEGQKKQNNE